VNANVQARGLPFARAVAVHSLGWLVAANLVGVWLAVCLLWPAVGNLIAPFTYGRWSPLHLDWQLYGWCSLPVVGALLAWCFDLQHPRVWRHAQIALGSWSAALALGGVAWLGGTVSGKLFLDWHGWARPLLPLAMHILWALLAVHTWWRWRRLSTADRAVRTVVLVLLLIVPSLLFWSTGRAVFPSVNPDSGGSTGASLLGSTLGIITIFMLTPGFLGVASRRRTWPFVWALTASWLVFAAIDRRNVSHHATAQIIALGLLLAWIPLLAMFWSRYAWPEAARPWLRAAVVWWSLLVVTGWITFLPGISEHLKFTHALVGHAHLAMAGLLTSVNAVIMIVLTGRAAPRSVFWLWQGGCAVYVASMLVLGWVETDHIAELYRSEPWTQGLLALRLAAGVAMTAGSARWLASFFRA
jgi:cytochrome c oxidase cbb3-type subunit 1